MSTNFFRYYQWLGPAVLTPLALWLWWRRYDGNIWLTAYACGLPIVYAYIVPAVGTNILKIWEFDCRFRLGRFRPQHGFVFGSATLIVVWFCHGRQVTEWIDLLQLMLILTGVLGFFNILYDISAIRTGFLRVYNQPWADGKGPEAIAMDYCPWFFGGYGAAFALALGIAERLAVRTRFDAYTFLWMFPVGLAFTIAIPVIGYRVQSMRRHGHNGCHPIHLQGSKRK